MTSSSLFLSLILPPTSTSYLPATTHIEHDYHIFRHKVEDIHTFLSTDIYVRPTGSFCHISLVSCSEIAKILASMPSKSCSLDLMCAWLVKKMQDVLVPVNCNLCNATICCAIFPASQKQAIILPGLKKSTLGSDHLTSCRPISNLFFTSKVVELIIAFRFVRHVEDNDLFPTRQSSFRRIFGRNCDILVFLPHIGDSKPIQMTLSL